MRKKIVLFTLAMKTLLNIRKYNLNSKMIQLWTLVLFGKGNIKVFPCFK